MVNVILLVISIGLAVVGQLLMKKGMILFGAFPVSELPFKVIPMILNPYVFLGLATFAVSSVFWLVILSRLELSLVYPFVSVAYIVVALFSMIFFKENVTIVRWLGIFTICVGVFLISRS